MRCQCCPSYHPHSHPRLRKLTDTHRAVPQTKVTVNEQACLQEDSASYDMRSLRSSPLESCSR